MEIAKHSIKDFADAKYNVLAIGSKKVIDAFPELQKFPEFKIPFGSRLLLSTEKIIKYVLLFYSENILRKSIPDLGKRKKEAALLAGFEFKKESNRFPDNLEKIFRCEDSEVNQLIIRVIRLNNNSAFEQLAVYEEARARQMYKLLSPGTTDEKTKEIHENIRRMSADIKDLEKQLLLEEKSKNLLTNLYYEIENIQLGIRPEEIAEAKKAGALNDILYNVYEQPVMVMKNVDARVKKKIGRPRKNDKTAS